MNDKGMFGIVLGALLLAACSGGSSPIGSAGSANQMPARVSATGHARPSFLSAARGAAHTSFDRRKSWLKPAVNQNRLLYVSDYNNGVVQVYNYPSTGAQNPPAGTLTGFVNPQGMCVDASASNVFITNTGLGNVLEYAWGATSASQSYQLDNQFPSGCSIDPTTGNLAASDILNGSGGPGAVSICTSPSSCVNYDQPGGLQQCYYIAYMPNGDLYVDGFSSYGFGMAYLAAGSTKWKPVAYTGAAINFPGGVQADGKHLTVGDQNGASGNSLIYRCTASAYNVDCGEPPIVLGGSTDVVQYFIKRGRQGVVGPDAVKGTANTWAYPAGGTSKPKKSIVVSDPYPLLIGSAVLLGPSNNARKR